MHFNYCAENFQRLPNGREKLELEQAVDDERRSTCEDAQKAYKSILEVG